MKWSPIGGGFSTGFRYTDRVAAAGGIRTIILKTDPTDDRARTMLKGKGAALSVAAPPAALPVIVQMTNSHTNACWSAAYDAASVIDNRAGLLRATSP